MEQNLIARLTESIAEKEKKRAEKKTFEVNGISMEFRKLSQAKQREYYGLMSEAMASENAETMIEFCTSLIYECCLTLQDPELHRANDVSDPLDIVRMLLDVREIDLLGGKLIDWMGFLKGEETGKN